MFWLGLALGVALGAFAVLLALYATLAGMDGMWDADL